MMTEARATRPTRTARTLATFTLLAGCAAHSTASDLDTVHTLVHERTQLELVARHARDPEAVDSDVSALAAQPLTLDNAVRIALLNNRELRADLLELGVARGQLVQASLFPNLDFDAQVRFPQESGRSRYWEFGAGIDLTQLILSGARRGVAQAELTAARFRAAGATLDCVP
jgi:cobalt-zinc-cadmium efflux system outer membrane protein